MLGNTVGLQVSILGIKLTSVDLHAFSTLGYFTNSMLLGFFYLPTALR